jgi:hypothetical protein
VLNRIQRATPQNDCLLTCLVEQDPIVRDFSFEKMVKRIQGAYSIFCDKFMYKDTNSEYLISDNEAFIDVLVTANRHEVVMCCVVTKN